VSLINEALKKARHEAARRDAGRQGISVPKTTAYEPRRRRGRWIGAAVAAALALGLAAAGGMWLARRGTAVGAATAADGVAINGARLVPAGAGPGAAAGSGAPDTPPATAGTGDPARAPSAETPAAGAETAGARDALETAPGANRGMPEAVAPRPGSAAAATPWVEAGPVESTAAETGAPAAGAGSEFRRGAPPEPPAAAAELPDVGTAENPPPRGANAAAERAAPAETSHVREAPLPGGGTLRLDGIAWSETTPAAVINGQIVGPGERVHGVRVVRVERDRVVVEIDGAEQTIRLP
jgi:hypothetical protein